MSAISYLKHSSLPTIDDVLRRSGLQRSPSVFSKVVVAVGFVSLGVIVGGGLVLWLGSPKYRKRLSAAIAQGIDRLSTAVGDGVERGSSGASGAAAKSNHSHSGKAAHLRG